MKGQSEFARLVSQIDAEHQAAKWAITAPNIGTAQHRFITRRLQKIGEYHQQLTQLVGPETAIRIVSERMDK